jgi:hypothetical protein
VKPGEGKRKMSFRTLKGFNKKLSSEQKDEVCDARDDAQGTEVGNINLRRLLRLRLASEGRHEEDKGLFTINEAFAEYHGGVQ